MSLQNAVEGADIVFHLAAALDALKASEELYWRVNVRGTQSLLESCLDREIRRIVYCSSVGVLGPIGNPPADETYPYAPVTIYEKTKCEAEEVALRFISEHGLPITIIRPAIVYGIGDTHSAMLTLFQAVQKGRFRLIGDGNCFVHTAYVDNVVSAFELAAEREGVIGQIYVIADEECPTWRKLTEIIAEVEGVGVPRMHIPKWLAKVAGYFFDSIAKTGIKSPVSTQALDFVTLHRGYDISKAKEELGYKPGIGLREGIRKTVEWYKQNGYLI